MVEEVWQEQTMLQLLKVVDLPLLDGVLQCIHNPTSPAPPPRPLAQSNPDLIYSSNHLDRQVLKAFRDAQYVGLSNDNCSCEMQIKCERKKW